MIVRMLRLTLVALFALVLGSPPAIAIQDDQPEILVLFWGDGCPHCEREREFLVDLRHRPTL